MPREKRNIAQNRRNQKQENKSRHGRQKADGKNAIFICAALQPVPDHPIGNPNRGNGNDEIASLNQKVGDAVFGAGENAGVKRREQKGKKPSAKCADTKQERIGNQILIGIQRSGPPCPKVAGKSAKYFPSYRFILLLILKLCINRK